MNRLLSRNNTSFSFVATVLQRKGRRKAVKILFDFLWHGGGAVFRDFMTLIDSFDSSVVKIDTHFYTYKQPSNES